MKRKQKRLMVIGAGLSFIAVAILLVLFALSRSISYFYMPADLRSNPVSSDTRIRLGGLVGAGSVIRDEGRVVHFEITDGSDTIEVRYTGILPDLFREGQGVVTEGYFDSNDDIFIADTVLAKHDENYMPKDVADRLKRDGVWEGDKKEGL
ncbi:cytochrome c maturation protein CcmE [Martelella alba]|uniref:Cytochrome c-type biogenesis protein CcmE n=1 Tax=Martelella alba TaxID=2590451 RepID=A0A506U4X6_9HYPH|nr:cytochrome c maturation protein CcmE [Martelella alba]TPW29432.1 cytochrome c maturation protein CcmE [Martelella alba]